MGIYQVKASGDGCYHTHKFLWVRRSDMKPVFNVTKPIIAMLHVPSLPGTPASSLSIPQIIDHVLREAEIYTKGKVDALLLENMHDVPYLKHKVGEEIVAVMTAIACAVKQNFELPCGIQILAAANQAALAVALAAGLAFIRAEGFVYAHIADEGLIESCAATLLRYRKAIGAEHIAIYTDIKKKHSSHSITADTSLAETAKTAEFFRSDALVITGRSTSDPVLISDLQAVKEASSLPEIIGSGITIDNISSLWDHADAFIVGSYFKENGQWSNQLSPDRVVQFMEHVRDLR